MLAACTRSLFRREHTGSDWYLEHLWTLSAGLHVHHWLLLMALLRALVAHHGCIGARAVGIAIGTGNSRHVARVVWVGLNGCWRVHLHLGVGRHTHVRSVRWLVRHHVASHSGSRGADELPGLCAEGDVLHGRARAVWVHLYLLWVTWHMLRLGTVCIWWHGPRRRMHGLIGVGILHLLGFEMRWALRVMRLARCATGGVVWDLSLLSLQVRRNLVLVGNGTVAHATMRC